MPRKISQKKLEALSLNLDEMALKFSSIRTEVQSDAGFYDVELRIPYSNYRTQGVTDEMIESILKAYQILPHIKVEAAVRGTYQLVPDPEGHKHYRRSFVEDVNGEDFLLHLVDEEVDNEMRLSEFRAQRDKLVPRFSAAEFADMGLISWKEIGLDPVDDAVDFTGMLRGNFVFYNALQYAKVNRVNVQLASDKKKVLHGLKNADVIVSDNAPISILKSARDIEFQMFLPEDIQLVKADDTVEIKAAISGSLTVPKEKGEKYIFDTTTPTEEQEYYLVKLTRKVPQAIVKESDGTIPYRGLHLIDNVVRPVLADEYLASEVIGHDFAAGYLTTVIIMNKLWLNKLKQFKR